MLRRPFRALTAFAVLATATAALVVAPAGTASAGRYCGSGTAFTGTISGTLAPNQTQVWETDLVGTAEIGYRMSPSYTTELSVNADSNGECSTRCWDTRATSGECTAYGVGSVVVRLWNRSATPVQFTLSERTPIFSGPACDNDRDDDYDGAGDYPADSGCTSQFDPIEHDESGGCTATAAGDACDVLSQGAVVTSADLVAPDAALATGQSVRGYLDVYRFPVAGGASVTVPCVVLTAPRTLNPCATGGGTFVSRTATLVDQTLPQPTVTVRRLATVNVCDGRITVTVASIGVENVPILTPC